MITLQHKSIPVEHDAHIQTWASALRAAFEFGRQSHYVEPDFGDYDVSFALAKYREWQGESSNQQPESEHEPEQSAQVVGGGATIVGKILWLLESSGPMRVNEIVESLKDVCDINYDNACNTLFRLQKQGLTVSEKTPGKKKMWRSTRIQKKEKSAI